MILDYNITLLDESGGALSYISTVESYEVASLRCCADYTYQVVARTSSGYGTPSQTMRFTTSNAVYNGKERKFNVEIVVPHS